MSITSFVLIKVSNPHFKWGFIYNPSGVCYWFRQRRVRKHH